METDAQRQPETDFPGGSQSESVFGTKSVSSFISLPPGIEKIIISFFDLLEKQIIFKRLSFYLCLKRSHHDIKA